MYPTVYIEKFSNAPSVILNGHLLCSSCDKKERKAQCGDLVVMVSSAIGINLTIGMLK